MTRGSLPATDVIRGGCPDGFWARQNCDLAARMGLCTLTTIEDHRPVDLRTAGQPAEPDTGSRNR